MVKNVQVGFFADTLTHKKSPPAVPYPTPVAILNTKGAGSDEPTFELTPPPY